MQGHTITEYGRSDGYSFNMFPTSLSVNDQIQRISDMMQGSYQNAKVSTESIAMYNDRFTEREGFFVYKGEVYSLESREE
jgi:hypothetical protein